MIATVQPPQEPKDVLIPTPPKQLKSVLLVDPYAISRLGLRVLLSQNFGPAHLSECANLQKASSMVQKLQPHLLILSLHFKEDLILEFIRATQRICKHTRILGFGDRLDPHRSRRAARAGINGLVELQQPYEVLVDSIDTLLNGEYYFSRVNRARFLGETLFSPDKATDAPLRVLSNRERQIFQLIGQGLSIRQMAQSIQRSPKTVETYRENIKHKLKIDNASHLHRITRTWVESGVIDLQTTSSSPHANAL